MSVFQIVPAGPFSLRASGRFLEGFTPARYRGGGDGADGTPRMRMAFPVEGSWQTAGVVVAQPEPDRVEVTVEGPEPAGLRAQVARVLSLDVDGEGFDAVRRADPVVDEVAARYPGLRPVGFYSPYEAACWAVIGHRIRMAQAARLKERIAETYGEQRVVDQVRLYAFPTPQRLLEVVDEIDLPGVKLDRLRGLAAAALDGRLDAGRLRALDPGSAMAHLRELDGIGPFSAELVLVRGAGAPDVFPTNESRLHASMRELYGEPDADVRRLAAIAARWAPFRAWVSVLIRSYREDTVTTTP